ncbi:MAG: hypothetical protein GWP08_18605 [Nitrospiraceae bacterium]|nr:hypothetical protein [Nitrospiraceae bacterium]
MKLKPAESWVLVEKATGKIVRGSLWGATPLLYATRQLARMDSEHGEVPTPALITERPRKKAKQ